VRQGTALPKIVISTHTDWGKCPRGEEVLIQINYNRHGNAKFVLKPLANLPFEALESTQEYN
jgi:hypothetical protein